MSHNSLIICQPTFKYDKKLKTICEPLYKGFGIDTFWYYSISANGELTYISNNQLISEYFYSNELFKGHPYFKAPKYLQSGFFFDDFKSKEYSKTQGKMHNCVSIDQIFMMMNVNNVKAEGYGFALVNSSRNMTNTILNNLYVLRKFINYFKNEAKDVIQQLGNFSIDLPKLCVDSFSDPTQYFNELSSKDKIRSFLRELDYERSESLNTLTEREKECLKWLVKGLSAVEIGEKTHLSNRTVESYLENVKNKLGCRTKRELFDIIMEHTDFLNLQFF